MKRKRRSDQVNDPQTCDLILTDANGRSVRVHKALLMDRSDYFASLLQQYHLNELQLDENYLIELIQYLYRHESDEQFLNNDNDQQVCSNYRSTCSAENADLEILMQLLVLAKKYSFKNLSTKLRREIDFKIQPSSVVQVYNLAIELKLEELRTLTRFQILTWLPQLDRTEAFHILPEESIREIFALEAPDIDNECKLNALSAWWSHNKKADMTSLWVSLVTQKSSGS